MQFRSYSCLTRVEYKLEFDGSSPENVRISQIQGWRHNWKPTTKIVSLTREEAEQIDKMRFRCEQPKWKIHFWSGKSYRIDWYRGGKTATEEEAYTRNTEDFDSMAVIDGLLKKAGYRP